MYIVTIENDGVQTEIHGYIEKLASGSVVKGINSIDSFSFSLYPSNAGFHRLFDFKTLVKVYNTAKSRYEFQGRVLYTSTQMNDEGLITKEVTCESFLGYLCDSQQLYAEERSWNASYLWNLQIRKTHNAQVEESKKLYNGDITFITNKPIFCGIQRENTWETVKKKLLDEFGAEIQYRVVDGKIYIDILEKIGEEKTTEIALSKNMKSIVREKDPTAYITRLIPLGAKLGDDGEERLTIESVNNGSMYLDDAEAIAVYGIHVGYVEFDDVTDASNLMTKATAWMKENNKVQIKYSATALDLSLIGLDIDDFEVGNYHPIKNALLDIDDTARIIKKTINICEEVESTIEFGESFKTLTELQMEYHNQLKNAMTTVEKIEADYVTNQQLVSERAYTSSLIQQMADQITLSVSGAYVTQVGFEEYKQEAAAELSLKIGRDENSQIVSMLNAAADVISIKSNRLTISSDYFTLTANGQVTARDAFIEGTIRAKSLTILEGATITGLIANEAKEINAFYQQTSTQSRRNVWRAGGINQELKHTPTGSETILLSHLSAEELVFTSSLSIGGGDPELTTARMDYLGVEQASDRRVKHDIEALSDEYTALFDLLKPVRFRYNADKSDRFHTGFIAQELEEAITGAGLTTDDLAAHTEMNGIYGIRYEELIALCVNEIQKLKTKVKEMQQ